MAGRCRDWPGVPGHPVLPDLPKVTVDTLVGLHVAAARGWRAGRHGEARGRPGHRGAATSPHVGGKYKRADIVLRRATLVTVLF